MRSQPAPGAFREGDRSSADHEARGHPLHVPLPRPRERLVEIVQIEQHLTFRRAETPKLDRCASPQSCTLIPLVGVPGQVIGDHDRRPAIERERRDRHPAVPDRHQVGEPGLSLLLEERDQIGSVGGGLPARVGRARRLLASGLAASHPLIGGGLRARSVVLSVGVVRSSFRHGDPPAGRAAMALRCS